jgi:uncharacterized protein YsxB (DUF464 family)
MIKVSYSSLDDSIVELVVDGHADFAKYGEDIVCSAVSAVVVGGFNALKNSDDYKLTSQDGYASLKLLGVSNEHDKVVVKTILRQLETIADSYPRNVEVKEKRSD